MQEINLIHKFKKHERYGIALLVFILSLSALHSQTTNEKPNRKFDLIIEYSPNLSGISNEVVPAELKLSHNIFLKVAYPLKSELTLTTGIGYFNTGERSISKLNGTLGLDEIQFIDNYNYVLIPVGVLVNYHGILLNPEIGLGFNISNKHTQKKKFLTGAEETDTEDLRLYMGKFNRITIPVMLSIYKEFGFAKYKFIFGLKTYSGLIPMIRNIPRKMLYYGLGLNWGVKF